MYNKKIIIEMSPDEFQNQIKKALHDFGITPAPPNTKIYTINTVAKRLGMAHNTIKKLCLHGVIETTRCGRITEEAVQKYLENK